MLVFQVMKEKVIFLKPLQKVNMSCSSLGSTLLLHSRVLSPKRLSCL